MRQEQCRVGIGMDIAAGGVCRQQYLVSFIFPLRELGSSRVKPESSSKQTHVPSKI